MPTDKEARKAAARKFARQSQRRAEAAARRRRRNQILATAAGVIVVLGVVAIVLIEVVGVGGNKKVVGSPNPSAPATGSAPATSAQGSSRASTAPSAAASPYPTHAFHNAGKPTATTGPCHYAETKASMSSPADKDVGLPPDPARTPSTGTAVLDIATSAGPIQITLDRSLAPCAVQSTIFLVQKGFYDNTACPRLVTAGIYVLQCGDPSNTQTGGPTYSYKSETSAKTTYTAGVVAMANTGRPDSTGSQFFIIYKDSLSLPKDYSVIGEVSKGLDVVTKVAAKGAAPTDPSHPGDGKPIAGLTLTSVTVAST